MPGPCFMHPPCDWRGTWAIWAGALHAEGHGPSLLGRLLSQACLLAWHGCCASQLLRCQLCVLIAGMSCLRLLYHAGLSLTAQQRPGSRQHLNLTRMHTSMQPGIIQGFWDQDLQLQLQLAVSVQATPTAGVQPALSWQPVARTVQSGITLLLLQFQSACHTPCNRQGQNIWHVLNSTCVTMVPVQHP